MKSILRVYYIYDIAYYWLFPSPHTGDDEAGEALDDEAGEALDDEAGEALDDEAGEDTAA